MTPQSEGRYASSLLFKPRPADGKSGGADYKLPRTSGTAATRSPSPTPDHSRQREGSFFREGSASFGGSGAYPSAPGSRFSRENSVHRDSQPDTPATARRGGVGGERSRLGQQSQHADATPGSSSRPLALGRSFSPGAGARGRRRSTTPIGQQPQEAPTPPPTNSLFGGASVGAAWTIPDVGEPSEAPERDGGQAAAVEAPSQDTAEQWVIVYGFRAGDVELLLQEFGKCGKILQHGTFGKPAGCNWLYLQFEDKWAAQRALYRDGEQLSSTLMIGVRPLDVVHRSAIRQHLVGPQTAAQDLTPKPALQRRYLINAEPSQGVPEPTRSMWNKVNEFVFGL